VSCFFSSSRLDTARYGVCQQRQVQRSRSRHGTRFLCCCLTPPLKPDSDSRRCQLWAPINHWRLCISGGLQRTWPHLAVYECKVAFCACWPHQHEACFATKAPCLEQTGAPPVQNKRKQTWPPAFDPHTRRSRAPLPWSTCKRLEDGACLAALACSCRSWSAPDTKQLLQGKEKNSNGHHHKVQYSSTSQKKETTTSYEGAEGGQEAPATREKAGGRA